MLFYDFVGAIRHGSQVFLIIRDGSTVHGIRNH